MIQRSLKNATVAIVALALLGGSAAAAPKYRYGKYRKAGKKAPSAPRTTPGGAPQDSGFYIYLDGMLANPRNTDAVVVTAENGGVFTPIVPLWDDEAAVRFGGGYQWAGGNRVEGRVTAYTTDIDTFVDGSLGSLGMLHFAIGPPIPMVGDIGAPGTALTNTEISMTTADIMFGHDHPVTESFSLDWSLGLRYALFEQDEVATYTQLGGASYTANKSNEGEMVGVRGSIRGEYRFARSFGLSGTMGLSFLDGELTAQSSLTAAGQSSPASFSSLVDDSRSGSIQEAEVGVHWYSGQDRVRITVGWSQAQWRDIADDLMRNFSTTSAPLRDRPDVTLSAYVIGARVRF